MARPKKETTNETIQVTSKTANAQNEATTNEVVNDEIKVETKTNINTNTATNSNNSNNYIGSKFIINRLDKTITKPNQYFFNDILGTKKATFGMNNVSAFEVTNDNIKEFEALLKQYTLSL